MGVNWHFILIKHCLIKFRNRRLLLEKLSWTLHKNIERPQPEGNKSYLFSFYFFSNTCIAKEVPLLVILSGSSGGTNGPNPFTCTHHDTSGVQIGGIGGGGGGAWNLCGIGNVRDRHSLGVAQVGRVVKRNDARSEGRLIWTEWCRTLVMQLS